MSNAIFPSTVRGLGYTVLKSLENSVIVQNAPNFASVRIQQNRNPLWRWELQYEILFDDRITATLTYTDLKTMLGFYQARGGNFDDFLFLDPDDNNVGPGMITATWLGRYPYALGMIIIDNGGHAQQVSSAPAGALSGYSVPTWNHAGGTTNDGTIVWSDLGAALNGGTNWPNPQAQLQLIQDTVSGIWYSPVQRNLGGQFYEDITDLNGAITVYANGVLQVLGSDYTIVGPGLSFSGNSFRGLVLRWAAPPTAPITTTFNYYYRVRFEMSKQGMEKFSNQWWTAAGSLFSNKSDVIKLVSSRAPAATPSFSEAAGISNCAPACVDLIQKSSGVGSASFSFTTGTGSSIAVALAVNDGGATSFDSVTDDKGNIYVDSGAYAKTSNTQVAIYYSTAPPFIDSSTVQLFNADNGGPGTGLPAGNYVFKLALNKGSIWSNIVTYNLTVPTGALDGTNWWEIIYDNPPPTLSGGWIAHAWVSFNSGSFQHFDLSQEGSYMGVTFVYDDAFTIFDSLAFPTPSPSFIPGITTITANFTGPNTPFVWIYELSTSTPNVLPDVVGSMSPTNSDYGGATLYPSGDDIGICSTPDFCLAICGVGGDSGTITDTNDPAWTLDTVQGGNAPAFRFFSAGLTAVPFFINSSSTNYAVGQTYFPVTSCEGPQLVANRRDAYTPDHPSGTDAPNIVAVLGFNTGFFQTSIVYGITPPPPGDRITCPASGHYLIGCSTLSGLSTSTDTYALLLNGITVASGSSLADLMLETDLTSGDYIQIKVTSGVSSGGYNLSFGLWMVELERTIAQIDADPESYVDLSCAGLTVPTNTAGTPVASLFTIVGGSLNLVQLIPDHGVGLPSDYIFLVTGSSQLATTPASHNIASTMYLDVNTSTVSNPAIGGFHLSGGQATIVGGGGTQTIPKTYASVFQTGTEVGIAGQGIQISCFWIIGSANSIFNDGSAAIPAFNLRARRIYKVT